MRHIDHDTISRVVSPWLGLLVTLDLSLMLGLFGFIFDCKGLNFICNWRTRNRPSDFSSALSHYHIDIKHKQSSLRELALGLACACDIVPTPAMDLTLCVCLTSYSSSHKITVCTEPAEPLHASLLWCVHGGGFGYRKPHSLCV